MGVRAVSKYYFTCHEEVRWPGTRHELRAPLDLNPWPGGEGKELGVESAARRRKKDRSSRIMAVVRDAVQRHADRGRRVHRFDWR